MYKDLAPKCGSVGVFTAMCHETTPDTHAEDNIFMISMQSSSEACSRIDKVGRSRPLRINVSNDTLCFFGAVLSCPSARDMYTLGSVGYRTGTSPLGKEIIPVLQIQYDDDTSQNPYANRLSQYRPSHLAVAPHEGTLHADGGSSISLISCRQVRMPVQLI